MLGGVRWKRKYLEHSIETTLFITAIISIIITGLIFYFLFHEGIKAFEEVGILNLISGQKWHPAGDIYGMMPLIINSILITFLALFINISIGFPLAIYLAELAGKKERDILRL